MKSPVDRSEARAGWLLTAPALATILFIALFPLGWTVWESLHEHDLRMPWLGRPFVGLGNYHTIMRDERFVAIPKLIETPKLNDATRTDRRMLARLRRYAKG